MKSPPSERDWDHLVRAIERGNCVLVLGSEVTSEPGFGGATLAEVFAAGLLGGSGEHGDTAEGDDARNLDRRGAQDEPYSPRPLEIAQRWLDAGGQRWKLEDRAVDFYQRYAAQTSDLHRALAQLPFKVYLNTTQDRFLQNAFTEQATRQPQFSHYHFREVIATPLKEPTVDCPLVYNLYGEIDDPGSLVLSESDLLFFLESVVTGTPPLPPAVEGLLRNDDSAFLFLGFGFHQWHVRLLLHTLLGPDRYARRDRHRPSMVLESEDFYAHPDSHRTVAFFRHQHTFEFRELPLAEFAAQLVNRCAKPRVAPQETLPEGAPLVFLSYRHLDEEPVKALKDALRRRGIDTWQDRDQLRGGERWELALKKVIDDCHYFLLCQTPSLMEATETVVFKELKQATRRQDGLHPDEPKLFIIPGILRPCTGLASLSALHMPDLTTAEGIDRFCDTILADWAKLQGAT